MAHSVTSQSRSSQRQNYLWQQLPGLNSEEEPTGLQGQVRAKRIKDGKHKWHRMDATLSRGTLRLYGSSKKDTPVQMTEKIDLYDAVIKCSPEHNLFEFVLRTRSLRIKVDRKDLASWLLSLQAHYIYRQRRLAQREKRGGVETTADQSRGGSDVLHKHIKARDKLKAVHSMIKDLAKVRMDLRVSGEQISTHRLKEYVLTLQLASRDIQDIEILLRRVSQLLGDIIVGSSRSAPKRKAQKTEEIAPETTNDEKPEPRGQAEERPVAVEQQDNESESSTSSEETEGQASDKNSESLKNQLRPTESDEQQKRLVVTSKNRIRTPQMTQVEDRGRRSLPALAPPPQSITLATIGQVLRKTPITFYEPLSVLQVMCEEMSTSALLDKAATQPDPIERLILVAAYAVSAYSTKLVRTRKPFDPLLGETFEYDRTDTMGWKFIAEQTSANPDVSSCHVEGRNWVYWHSFHLNMHSSLGGVEARLDPEYGNYLKLSKWHESYSWTKVSSSVHNIFKASERFVGFFGEMCVQCSNGYRCLLTFDRSTKARTQRVSGVLSNAGKQLGVTIEGQWAGDLYKVTDNGKTCIFTCPIIPVEMSAQYYGFGPQALRLNELTDELKAVLPPTDSRLRPDIRLLEEGKLEQADKEQRVIEQKQRGRLQAKTHRPLWFAAQQNKNKKAWIYNGNYWTERQNHFKDITFPT